MKRFACCLGMLTSLTFSGCGDGPRLTEVQGTVTLDGKPLQNAELVFVPQNTEVRSPSYGMTDANGKYVLKFTALKSGAIPGQHHVQVSTGTSGDTEKAPTSVQTVPSKYQKEGSIIVDVKPGPNTIDIKLDSVEEPVDETISADVPSTDVPSTDVKGEETPATESPTPKAPADKATDAEVKSDAAP